MAGAEELKNSWSSGGFSINTHNWQNKSAAVSSCSSLSAQNGSQIISMTLLMARGPLWKGRAMAFFKRALRRGKARLARNSERPELKGVLAVSKCKRKLTAYKSTRRSESIRVSSRR